MGLATANSLLTGDASAMRRARGSTRRHGDALLMESLYSDQRGNLAALDASAMLSAQSFPLTPEELVAKAKDFIEADYGGADSSWLADNFVFVGPFVGPLSRQQYLDALGGNLNPSDGFPDLVGRQFGFTADPVRRARPAAARAPAPGMPCVPVLPVGSARRSSRGASGGSRGPSAPSRSRSLAPSPTGAGSRRHRRRWASSSMRRARWPRSTWAP